MKNLLIGSRALEYWSPDFKCKPNADWDIISLHEINDCLREVNLSVKYHSATFDSSLYNECVFDIESYDLTEYAVYTIFEVLEGKEILGYVQINCQYSSYNGNEYSNFQFVNPKQVNCTVFNAYNP